MIHPYRRPRGHGKVGTITEETASASTSEAVSFSRMRGGSLCESTTELSSPCSPRPIFSSVCLSSSSSLSVCACPQKIAHVVFRHEGEEECDSHSLFVGGNVGGLCKISPGADIQTTETQDGKNTSPITSPYVPVAGQGTLRVDNYVHTDEHYSQTTGRSPRVADSGVKQHRADLEGESTDPSPSTDHPLSPLVDSSPCSFARVFSPHLCGSINATSPSAGEFVCGFRSGSEGEGDVRSACGVSPLMFLARTSTSSDCVPDVRKEIPRPDVSSSDDVPQATLYLGHLFPSRGAVTPLDTHVAEPGTSLCFPHLGTPREAHYTDRTRRVVVRTEGTSNRGAADAFNNGAGAGVRSSFCAAGGPTGTRGSSDTDSCGPGDVEKDQRPRGTAPAETAEVGVSRRRGEARKRPPILSRLLSTFTWAERVRSRNEACMESSSQTSRPPIIAEDDKSLSCMPEAQPFSAAFQTCNNGGVEDEAHWHGLMGDCRRRSDPILDGREQVRNRAELASLRCKDDRLLVEQAVASFAEEAASSESHSAGSCTETPRGLSGRSSVWEAAVARVAADAVFSSKNEKRGDDRDASETGGHTNGTTRENGEVPLSHGEVGDSDEDSARTITQPAPPNWWWTLVRSTGWFLARSDVPSVGGSNAISENEGSIMLRDADISFPLERRGRQRTLSRSTNAGQLELPFGSGVSYHGTRDPHQDAVMERDDHSDKAGNRDTSRMRPWWQVWDGLFGAMSSDEGRSCSTCADADKLCKDRSERVSEFPSHDLREVGERECTLSMRETSAEDEEPARREQLLHHQTGNDSLSSHDIVQPDENREYSGSRCRQSLLPQDMVSPAPTPIVVTLASLSRQTASSAYEGSISPIAQAGDDDDDWDFFADEAQMDAVLEAALASPGFTNCLLGFRASEEDVSADGNAGSSTVEERASLGANPLPRSSIAELREHLKASLRDKSSRMRRHFRGVRQAVRTRDLQAVRRELADMAEVGGPEVSGIWASVKVGIGIATLASGHVIMGGIMLAMATSAVGSAVLWGRHRDQFRRWMAGEEPDGGAQEEGERRVQTEAEHAEGIVRNIDEGETYEREQGGQPTWDEATRRRTTTWMWCENREETDTQRRVVAAPMIPQLPLALAVASCESSVCKESGRGTGTSFKNPGDDADETACAFKTKERGDRGAAGCIAGCQTPVVDRGHLSWSGEENDSRFVSSGYRDTEGDGDSCDFEAHIPSMADVVAASIHPDCAAL
ncbi:putative transmembrane protein [Toxoplasma gondii TgCatPRC2]|uniref:Putative transmembrane protein n=1 Tax=Toxoplasma gondii TgCatPRC2 TaxID=1130821 RepID=A0A151H0N2_TOXGO|nr:putative transmembrane protein [Toxoplasma gondii TgCatPRC2]